jgi:hypothetical protein
MRAAGSASPDLILRPVSRYTAIALIETERGDRHCQLCRIDHDRGRPVEADTQMEAGWPNVYSIHIPVCTTPSEPIGSP